MPAFGGDPDNFQFPRYCLDMSVLRAYENGKPAHTPSYLRLNFDGPKAGELIFVAGHPGNTDRELTLAQLKAQRDFIIPPWLLRRSEQRGRYIEFAERSPENQHITADPLISIENAIKVRRKQLDALHDDALLARKAEEQAQLSAKIAADPTLKAELGDPFGDIAKATSVEAGLWLPYIYLERGVAFDSQLFNYARTLVRGAAERAKPNDQRLREYTDAALPRIEQELGAPVPVYPELERITLTQGLQRMREWLGPDDPVVHRLLAKDSPSALAQQLISGTKLGDPAVRLALWKGGEAAINASTDPMILLAKSVDADARAIRKHYEDEVEGPQTAGAERIARARFADLRHPCLSGCHLHAAAQLRHGAGLDGERPHGRAVHEAGDGIHALDRAPSRSACRTPGPSRAPSSTWRRPSISRATTISSAAIPAARPSTPRARSSACCSTATSTRSRVPTGSTPRRTARWRSTRRSSARR